MHEETAEIVASGEVPLEVPLADRLRTFMASQEVERVGLVADSAREPALPLASRWPRCCCRRRCARR